MSDTLTINEAAARVGAKPTTVRRWVTVGVMVGDRRVKLAHRRLGGRLRIPPAALEEFDRACNPEAPVPTESPSAARRRRERERDELLAELKGGRP
jgi:excisionase family DNA binding protein